MQFLQPTYHSKLYRDFKSIDGASFRDLIHFFERSEDDIRQLDFDEYFEMLYLYVNALFEVGAYHKHVIMADEVIEAAICHNIQYYKQEDIFKKSLFRKAASLYNTSEYRSAEHILRELVRIEPGHKDAGSFLKKCLRNIHVRPLQAFRASAIALFLSSALVICTEVLLIRPFYPAYTGGVEALRVGLFVAGWVVLIAGEAWHRWWAHRRVMNFVSENKRRKGVGGDGFTTSGDVKP